MGMIEWFAGGGGTLALQVISLGVMLLAVFWSLMETLRYRRKVAQLGRKLEDTPLPGPNLQPLPNPRPNPPDSGLSDEEWERYLAQQREQKARSKIKRDPRTYKELFFNRGVYLALDAALKSPKPLCPRDSLERAQMGLAHMQLLPHFGGIPLVEAELDLSSDG